jgi:hypothetical protein
MTVRGGKETARNFRQLASFVSVPLNATSRFALQPTLAAAKSNVRSIPFREGTGTLAASLTIKRLPSSSKVNPVHQVGPDSSKHALRQAAPGSLRASSGVRHGDGCIADAFPDAGICLDQGGSRETVR